MKNILLISFCFFYFLSSTTNAQWEMRYPKQPTAGINDIFFLDQSTGFAVNGSGSILKTTDGGLHWTITKHYQRDYLTEVKFVDSQNGFIISPFSYIGDSQDFIFTTDGGSYWQSTYLGTSDALTFLPLSTSEIIKSGDQGTISKLDNFFGLWSERYRMPTYFEWDIDVPYGDIKKFQKLNSGRILALGSSWKAFQVNFITDSVAFILFSDDNGNTWDTLWCDLPEVLSTFSFANDNFGWMGGNENKIYHTTDGGISWQLSYSEINPAPYSSISKIEAIDPSTVFAVTTKGKIISSADGGINWDTTSIIPYSYYDSYFGLKFINTQKGFVFGPDLWTTTNGGVNWTKVDDSIKPNFMKIQFLNTSLGYGIGGDGYYGGSSFYKTSDGGYTWAKLYDGNPNSAFNGFFMKDSLNGWLTEFNQLFKTTNGGYEWNEVFVDTVLEFMRGVEFFNDDLGVLFEVSQRFNNFTLNYLTTDGGESWQKYQMGDEPFLTSFLKIKRTDPSHIWVVNQQGVWLSRDTVKTWTNVSTEVEGWAAGFDFLDSLNGWVAHMDSQQDKIKFTKDGGITWNTYMKPFMVQTQDLVIDGRDYFGKINVTVAGMEGSLFRYLEDWDYAYQQNSYTNGWLTSIAIYREGNTAHKWVAGSGGIILYTSDYITDVKENNSPELIISEFRLEQNYPNPFNPVTVISYQLPAAGNVTLKVFDVLGNEVATLVDEYKPAGGYEVEFNIGRDSSPALASGIYFYRLQVVDPEKSSVQGFIETKKMLLLK